MFSVGSEAESEALIELALMHGVLGRQDAGALVAVELAMGQSLERLDQFGADLERLHDTYLVPEGRCSCVEDPEAERRRAKAAARKAAAG